MVNKNGGYNGRLIEYDEYDTKADANEGIVIARNWQRMIQFWQPSDPGPLP